MTDKKHFVLAVPRGTQLVMIRYEEREDGCWKRHTLGTDGSIVHTTEADGDLCEHVVAIRKKLTPAMLRELLGEVSPTMPNAREQEKEVEEKLIEMLQDGAVFISGQLDTLCVNCNDLFYWACADAENMALADLDEVYRHFKADTLEEWCCLRRGMRPQRPLITQLKERGKWSAALEALPERTDA